MQAREEACIERRERSLCSRSIRGLERRPRGLVAPFSHPGRSRSPDGRRPHFLAATQVSLPRRSHHGADLRRNGTAPERSCDLDRRRVFRSRTPSGSCDLRHIRRGSLVAPPIPPHTPSMEPEEFEFTDADLEAWLDGRSAATCADSDLARFILDLRCEVESFSEEPSPKLASWIADSSPRGSSEASSRAQVAELDDILESLTYLC